MLVVSCLNLIRPPAVLYFYRRTRYGGSVMSPGEMYGREIRKPGPAAWLVTRLAHYHVKHLPA